MFDHVRLGHIAAKLTVGMTGLLCSTAQRLCKSLNAHLLVAFIGK